MARLAKNPSAGEHRSSGLGIVIRFISPFSVITTRSVLSIPPLSSVTKMSAMVHRVNLAPAVRSAASGVPRSAVNFAIKGVHGGIGSGHDAAEHGQHGPRKDAIPSWVGSRGAYMQSTNVNGECRNGVRERKDVDGCRGVSRTGGGPGQWSTGRDGHDVGLTESVRLAHASPDRGFIADSGREEAGDGTDYRWLHGCLHLPS